MAAWGQSKATPRMPPSAIPTPDVPEHREQLLREGHLLGSDVHCDVDLHGLEGQSAICQLPRGPLLCCRRRPSPPHRRRRHARSGAVVFSRPRTLWPTIEMQSCVQYALNWMPCASLPCAVQRQRRRRRHRAGGMNGTDAVPPCPNILCLAPAPTHDPPLPWTQIVNVPVSQQMSTTDCIRQQRRHAVVDRSVQVQSPLLICLSLVHVSKFNHYGASRIRRAGHLQAQAAQRPGTGKQKACALQLACKPAECSPSVYWLPQCPQDGYAATATQLESIAPTQAAAPPAAALTFQQHKPAPQQQHCQQPAWGLHPEDAKYYKTLDEEQVRWACRCWCERASCLALRLRQVLPSHPPSPSPPLPLPAPLAAAGDCKPADHACSIACG